MEAEALLNWDRNGVCAMEIAKSSLGHVVEMVSRWEFQKWL